MKPVLCINLQTRIRASCEATLKQYTLLVEFTYSPYEVYKNKGL